MKIFINIIILLSISISQLIGDPSDQTSVTDYDQYRNFCLLAATDDEVFKTFKRYPIIREVMQHSKYEFGLEQLNYINRNYPHLLPLMRKFRKNDTVGLPKRYYYEGVGIFSPTNLRYIKIAGDIESLFGDLNGKKIIEIGCCYGGQCKILSDLYQFSDYTLVDLPEVLALALKYLEVLKVSKVQQWDYGDDIEYDLVISNYAFSECSREIQTEYLEKIISKSKRGYMICNKPTHFNSPKPYSKSELIKMIKRFGNKVRVSVEKPSTGKGNYLITWKKKKID